MGRAKAGRKRKPGARHPSGQLIQRVAANDRVQSLRERFAVFDGGKKQPDQIYDPIGRAWAAGLLEGGTIDPVILRDIARTYARLYWSHWPTNSGIAQYGEMIGSGSVRGPANDDNPADKWFERLDTALRAKGRKAIDAVHALCVNSYHLPDEENDPLWLVRLLDQAHADKRRTIQGRAPCSQDRETLRLAIEGLLAMVS